MDKYIMGKEIEVDAVCDGKDILIPGIMEHIERAGIHSGDSISVYPAQTISDKAKATIEEYTKRLARALHVLGMINIQFIVSNEDEEVYVIEVNPQFQPYCTVYQQGNRYSDRTAGNQSNPWSYDPRDGI